MENITLTHIQYVLLGSVFMSSFITRNDNWKVYIILLIIISIVKYIKDKFFTP